MTQQTDFERHTAALTQVIGRGLPVNRAERREAEAVRRAAKRYAERADRLHHGVQAIGLTVEGPVSKRLQEAVVQALKLHPGRGAGSRTLRRLPNGNLIDMKIRMQNAERRGRYTGPTAKTRTPWRAL